MPQEDAGRPQFWDKRFRENFTPWDAGGVPAALGQFLKTETHRGRVLIPGCGSSYEVRAFAQAGFEVTAIDFAPAAVEQARRILGPLAQLVRLEDFFKFDPDGPFDLVYERAFLCALPPHTWPRYAPRLSELLRPEGKLAGFFFFDDKERGPPFGLKGGELDKLLGEHFDRTTDATVSDSIPIFLGKERWQIWKRL